MSDDVNNVVPFSGAKAPRKSRSRPETGDWRDALIYSQTPTGGQVLAKHLANAISIFRHDEEWEGVLGFDEFAAAVVTLKPVPWHQHDAPASRIVGLWSD